MATASIQNELVRVASGLSGLTLSVAEFAVHIISVQAEFCEFNY